MSTEKLPKLVIFGDPKKGPVAGAIEHFKQIVQGRAEILETHSITTIRKECAEQSTPILHGDAIKGVDHCDYAVVFGGDGSIIATARNLSQANVPVIGVNLGKLGFLAEFSVEELEQTFDDIVAGKCMIEKRMMLDCRVFRAGREIFCTSAVNDVFITAGPPFRMIELRLLVDSLPLAGCVSDGMIVSTPTGSTAYNLSAGGPILAPRIEVMVLTPLCPHSLSFRPIVIGASSVVEIVGLQVNEGTTLLIDGQLSQTLWADDLVRVVRNSHAFHVVHNPVRSQWDTLGTKLAWAEKPKYRKSPDL